MIGIKSVESRAVYTVISVPTAEITVTVDNGISVQAMRINPDLEGMDIAYAVEYINSYLAPRLEGLDALDQKGVDSILAEMREESRVDPFIPSISQAVCEAAAMASGMALYSYVSSLSGLECLLPLPKSGAIASGMNFGTKSSYSGTPYWGFIAYGLADTDDAINGLWVCEKNWEKYIRNNFKVKVNVHSGNLIYPDSFFPTVDDLLSAMTKVIEESGFSGKVGIWADFDGNGRYCKEDGKYYGVVDRESDRDGLIAEAARLYRSYPLILIENPLCSEDLEGLALLRSRTKSLIAGPQGSVVRMDIFDGMTVSEAVEAARRAAADDSLIVADFSLSPGFRAMEYAAGLRVMSYMRCGMIDHANKALELAAAGIGQRKIDW